MAEDSSSGIDWFVYVDAAGRINDLYETGTNAEIDAALTRDGANKSSSLEDFLAMVDEGRLSLEMGEITRASSPVPATGSNRNREEQRYHDCLAAISERFKDTVESAHTVQRLSPRYGENWPIMAQAFRLLKATIEEILEEQDLAKDYPLSRYELPGS